MGNTTRRNLSGVLVEPNDASVQLPSSGGVPFTPPDPSPPSLGDDTINYHGILCDDETFLGRQGTSEQAGQIACMGDTGAHAITNSNKSAFTLFPTFIDYEKRHIVQGRSLQIMWSQDSGEEWHNLTSVTIPADIDSEPTFDSNPMTDGVGTYWLYYIVVNLSSLAPRISDAFYLKVMLDDGSEQWSYGLTINIS